MFKCKCEFPYNPIAAQVIAVVVIICIELSSTSYNSQTVIPISKSLIMSLLTIIILCGISVMIQHPMTASCCPNYDTIVNSVEGFHKGLTKLHSSTMETLNQTGTIIGIVAACLIVIAIGYKIFKYRAKRQSQNQNNMSNSEQAMMLKQILQKVNE